MIGFLDCTATAATAAAAPAGSEVVELETVLAGSAPGPLIVYAPPPGWSGEVAVAEALGRIERVILVRAERWDGQTTDPLAAVVSGLISGFGEAGIAAAFAELSAG